MNDPDHISESLETIFLGLKLKFFDADPGSMIRDGKNLDPGSGINIPDPQHCSILVFNILVAAAGPVPG
jgi:hypothetical protein